MSLLFTSADLAEALGQSVPAGIALHGFSIDTRSLRPGDLFVALRSDTGNGHHFLARAHEAQACAGLVDADGIAQNPPPAGLPCIVVPDPLAALRQIAAYARARFTGRLIAVTGSVGKTTTKEMLRAILGETGPTHAAHASFNNHIGVPLTLASLPRDCAYAVVEIGMNNPGEIAPLAQLAQPHAAIITAIASAHIGNMGSIEAIADEKAAIFSGLAPGGTAILPADTPTLPRLLAAVPTGAKRVLFAAADLNVQQDDATGTTARARLADQPVTIRVNAPGAHMLSNALAALHGALALGAPLAASLAGLARFTPVSGRGVQKPILDGRAVLLDESYNANTASVRAALGVLRRLPATRRIAILGDMLELGEFAAAEHLALLPALRESADLLYACGTAMKLLYDSCPAQMQGLYCPTSAELAPLAAAALRAGDAVLVKGSLGSRMAKIVDAITAQTITAPTFTAPTITASGD